MNYRIVVVFFVSLLLSGCSSRSSKILPLKSSFSVSIEQHGRPVAIHNEEVVLEKAEFVIVISFTHPDAVNVHSSFDNKTQASARLSDDLTDLPGFSEGALAQDDSAKQVLTFDDTACDYWDYVNDSDNQFSTVQKKNGFLVCRRKISKLRFIDRSHDKITVCSIADIPFNVIHQTYLQSMEFKTLDKLKNKGRAWGQIERFATQKAFLTIRFVSK